MRYQSLLSIAVASLSAVQFSAGAEDWRSMGGPPGGSVTSLASDGARALAVAPGGLFVAEGGGAWSLAPAAAGPASIRGMIAAPDGFYLWTADARLLRTDGAVGEQLVAPGSAGIVSVAADGARLYSIASDTRRGSFGDLLKSDDRGESWQRVETPEELAAVYMSGDLIIATGVSSFLLHRSTDGGQTWTSPVAPLVFGVENYTSAGSALYASAGSFTGAASIIRSTDDGATWAATAGFDGSRVLDFVAHGDHIYAASLSRSGSQLDIWRAPAGGGTWTLLASPAPGIVADSALVAHDGGLLLAISSAGSPGILRSTDGGATWTPAAQGISASTVGVMGAAEQAVLASDGAAGSLWRFDAAADEWASAGFPASAGGLLAVAPMGGSAWLAAGDFGGILRSTDDGRSWRAANNGVPRYEGTGGMQLREFNAFAARGATWLGGSGPGAEWPPPGSKGASAQETGGGGLVRSTDGAVSWQRSTAGLPVIGIAGDGSAHYPAVLTLLATADGFVAGTKAHGVYRSTDDGRSWTGGAAGLPPLTWTGGRASIVALAEFGSALYAGTNAADTTATLFRSTDGGATWSAAQADLPHAPVLGLRAHDGRLFAALGRVISGPGAGDGAGVWVTTDSATWAPVGEALAGRPATALALLDGALIAGTDGLGAWRLDSLCAPDLDGDGELTFFDFLMFQDLFAAGDLRADFTGDGVLDFFDFLAFQNAFAAGCD